ncbi:MAG: hypothetical protein PHD70_01950 [Anaerostipes sp.]|nr:hypothetical protein [Anaerostipes sp.]
MTNYETIKNKFIEYSKQKEIQVESDLEINLKDASHDGTNDDYFERFFKKMINI